MSEPIPQREIGLSLPLKILAASAIGITLGFGLCSAAVATNSTKTLVPAALGLMGLSTLGLVVSIVWLIVIGITNTFRR